MPGTYPEYPPPSAAPVLTAYDIVRSGAVATRRAELAKCTWLILGMVANLTLGEPESPDIIGQAQAEAVDPEFSAAMHQLGEYLATQETDLAAKPVQMAKSLPWATIIKILLAILAGL
jgi:hypothetical protein